MDEKSTKECSVGKPAIESVDGELPIDPSMRNGLEHFCIDESVMPDTALIDLIMPTLDDFVRCSIIFSNDQWSI